MNILIFGLRFQEDGGEWKRTMREPKDLFLFYRNINFSCVLVWVCVIDKQKDVSWISVRFVFLEWRTRARERVRNLFLNSRSFIFAVEFSFCESRGCHELFLWFSRLSLSLYRTNDETRCRGRREHGRCRSELIASPLEYKSLFGSTR